MQATSGPRRVCHGHEGPLDDLARRWERERRERRAAEAELERDELAGVDPAEALRRLREEPDDDQPWRR